jgi:hypothetical protein
MTETWYGAWQRLMPVGLVLTALTLPWSLSHPVAATPSQVLAQASAPTAPAPDLTKQATAALQLWRTKDFTQLRGLLSPSLQALLPLPELQRFWNSQVADVGLIKTIGQPRVVSAGSARLVLFPVQFEKMQGNVAVSYNDSNQIAGINFPTRQTVQQIAERSVAAMAKGDLISARDYFRPALKAEISPQQLGDKWKVLQQGAGRFQRIVGTKLIPAANANELDLVLVTLQFTKVTDDLVIVFDQNKEIVSVDFPQSAP